MSIINTKRTTSAAEVVKIMQKETQREFVDLKNLYAWGLQYFWYNSDFTAQELATELGNEAEELFTLHASIGQLLYTFDPQWVVNLSSNIPAHHFESGSLIIE